jgi:hypothetical protein
VGRLFFGEGGEDFFGCGAVAVVVADFFPDDFAFGVDDEGGGVGVFVCGVPADGVVVDEFEVGVFDEVVVFGEGFSGDEFLGVVFEMAGGAGVDEDELGAGGGDVFGSDEELPDLLGADGALVADPAAEEDEDDGAVFEEGGEGDGFFVEGFEGEIFGGVADGGLGGGDFGGGCGEDEGAEDCGKCDEGNGLATE